jgi:hypothetical protein
LLTGLLLVFLNSNLGWRWHVVTQDMIRGKPGDWILTFIVLATFVLGFLFWRFPDEARSVMARLGFSQPQSTTIRE